MLKTPKNPGYMLCLGANQKPPKYPKLGMLKLQKKLQKKLRFCNFKTVK